MKATKQIDIYITKKRNVRLIDVVQNDTGIQLVFTVQDFTIPSGATATLYVQKPSGKFVFQKDGITVANNTITVDLENQAITEHGKVPYQLSITSGSDEFTTFTGLMMVEKSLKDAGATESKSVIRAFDEVVSDHVAEFQTKAEQIVQACVATIPEDYAVMEAKVNELANGIKGSVSGAVVAVGDVSPVSHSPAIWIHGKNIFNNEKLETIISNYGGCESIDTGVRATVKNEGTWRYAMLKVLPTKRLIGKTLTLSFSAIASAMNTPRVAFGFSDSTGNDRIQPAISLLYSDAITITVTKEYASQYEFVAIWLYSNHTGTGNAGDYIDYKNLQVEIGDTATDYEAYLDPTTAAVRRCGRNIIPYPYKEAEATRQGITWREKATGKYWASGTTDDTGSYIMVCTTESKRLFLVAGVVYHFSCMPKESGLYYAYVKDASGTNFFDHGEGATFTPTASGYGAVTIVVSSNVTVSDIEFKPQLEIGTEKTFFEKPCEEAAFIPAADGTVSGMTSLSPNMTILTNTDGAIVECEYIIDTKTYIDNKISEILKGSDGT